MTLRMVLMGSLIFLLNAGSSNAAVDSETPESAFDGVWVPVKVAGDAGFIHGVSLHLGIPYSPVYLREFCGVTREESHEAREKFCTYENQDGLESSLSEEELGIGEISLALASVELRAKKEGALLSRATGVFSYRNNKGELESGPFSRAVAIVNRDEKIQLHKFIECRLDADGSRIECRRKVYKESNKDHYAPYRFVLKKLEDVSEAE